LGPAWSADVPTRKEAETHLCVPPPIAEGVQSFEIDLATGNVNGRKSYNTEQSVRVLVRNQNLFAYAYKITIDEAALPEPALAAWWSVLNADELTAPSGAPAAPKAPAAPAAPPSAECVSAIATGTVTAADNNLSSARAGFKNQGTDLADLVNALNKEAKEGGAKLQTENGECEDLVGYAVDMANALDLSSLDAKLKSTDSAKSTLNSDVGVLRHELDAARSSALSAKHCKDQAEADQASKPYEDGLAVAVASVTSFQPQYDAAVQRSKDLAGIRDALLKILSGTKPTWSIRFVGDYDEPTIATIKLFRRRADETTFPEDAFQQHKLRFGGRQRFALGVGALFTNLENPQYGSVQGYQLNPDGSVFIDPATSAPVLTRVVGLTEDSNNRANPIIAMHTRFHSSGVVAHHATLGVSTTLKNGGSAVEYLVGYSLSFAEERYFLTIGFYNGRVQHLQPGAFVGAKMPEDLANVPIRSDREWSGAFALSIRFK
jgi:hypothetical protein